MLYSYRAVDAAGQGVSGEREAASERELAEGLRGEGVILLETRRPGRAGQKTILLQEFLMLFERVSLVERMMFARNLAVMIGAGLPITRALAALEAQTQNLQFKKILAHLKDEITKGRTLAESLKPYENVFGAIFSSMVEAGEISGKLEQSLIVLSRQMKRDHDLRARVRGALIYPAIIISALVAIGYLMMTYVMPTLTRTFAELGVELPFTTRLLIGTSDFLIRYSWFAGGGLIIAVAGAIRAFRSRAGKQAFDRIILKVPVFGNLVAKLNSARFARTLASLISSGIAITKALRITSAVLGNTRFKAALEDAENEIEHGKTLAATLARYPDLFPPMVSQMIAVGEETGTITRMLLRLALFYEEEVNRTTKNLSTVVEPVLMIVIGVVVGFFALSMIQPIYGNLGGF